MPRPRPRDARTPEKTRYVMLQDNDLVTSHVWDPGLLQDPRTASFSEAEVNMPNGSKRKTDPDMLVVVRSP